MIDVVGIGLEGAAGLSETTRTIVAQATLLVGSDRHLSYFPHHAAQRLVLGNIYSVIEKLAQLADQETTVILVSGDPLFFGLGRLLLEKLPPQQLRFHPHVSSVQLAFSRIKRPWQDAQIVSVHGRSVEELTRLLQQGVKKIAILTDAVNNPRAIAQLTLALDLPTRYDFWVCEKLGADDEQIYQFSAAEAHHLASTAPFDPLNVVILEQTASDETALQSLPLLGLPDASFLSFSDRPGLMTKREIRLVVLGELALQPGQVVWDIGAGTGSVSVEIARLCPRSHVYAIEKTATGITLIEQNCQRLNVANVTVVAGTAPDILTKLPVPDRIFIGGSGGQLPEILTACEHVLAADGTVVLALATLEHLNTSWQWLSDRAWQTRLLQLQISRSVPIGPLTRFSPLNPVTIITAKKGKSPSGTGKGENVPAGDGEGGTGKG
ncbi:MAG: precorrin-6y C5,15-methyltransferase (decarboxylating) subunit CbiE [Cyanophyceae cyanobacterium]